MLLYRSCYWLGLVIRSVQLVQKLGAATVRSGSRPATVGYRFSGMLCFAVLQAERGDGRWEVKGQRIGGGGSVFAMWMRSPTRLRTSRTPHLHWDLGRRDPGDHVFSIVVLFCQQ
jgi:hypothetical protein